MKKSKLFLGGVVVTACAMAGAMPGAVYAASPPESPAGAEDTSIARVDVPLTAHQRLQDVASMKTALGYPVTAFRFENDSMVGEYSPASGMDVKTYLSDFQETYGTQPEISHVVVTMPSAAAKSLNASGRLSVAPPLSSNGRVSAYEAPDAKQANLDALLDPHRQRLGVVTDGALEQSAMATAGPTHWEPTTVDVQVTRPTSSTVLFDQYLYWHPGEAATAVLGSDDGWESEVNIYTSNANYQSGGRPSCPSDFKDRPFAKNYGWNWSVLYDAGFGMSTPTAPIGAYADYNDNSDECSRNAMAIGIRTPQVLGAWSNGMQEVLLLITAPRGLDTTGRVSGTVQPVNEVGCALAPWMSNTDCMGLTSSSYTARATLAYSRGWTAPSLCWNSGSYGLIAPSKYTC